MARHELILRLDGALWLTIIFKTPLAPRRAMKIQNQQKKTESPRGGASRYAGGHGGLQAPRQGVWRAEAPQEQQGVWGAAAPQ